METIKKFSIIIEIESDTRTVAETFRMSDKAGWDEYNVLTALFEWLGSHGYEPGLADYFDEQ